jgi:hypothetical protein
MRAGAVDPITRLAEVLTAMVENGPPSLFFAPSRFEGLRRTSPHLSSLAASLGAGR